MLVQTIIDNVLQHLGNRSTGVIGSTPVATAVLGSINKGQRKIVEKFDPQDLRTNLTVSLTSSDYVYALPVDAGGREIKNIIAAKLQASGETNGVPLVELSTEGYDDLFPVMDSGRTGRPVYFHRSGDDLELYPWPDGVYTITLRCNLWPLTNIAGDVETDVGWVFDDALEAYATYDCFAKLQQIEDAKIWGAIYWTELKDVIGTIRKKPLMSQNATLRDLHTNSAGIQEARDPFVRRIS